VRGDVTRIPAPAVVAPTDAPPVSPTPILSPPPPAGGSPMPQPSVGGAPAQSR
jgi:hypothetical protein